MTVSQERSVYLLPLFLRKTWCPFFQESIRPTVLKLNLGPQAQVTIVDQTAHNSVHARSAAFRGKLTVANSVSIDMMVERRPPGEAT